MDNRSKAAWVSVASNTTLMTGKLIIGFMTGSVSVISEAIHSANDLLASFIAVFAVKSSAKPPDKEHPYGHGKIENISGTIEAILIFVAALLIINEAVEKIRSGMTHIEPGWGMLIMGISAVLNFIISRYLLKIAKVENSVALEADGLHLLTDVYTSLGVFIGLLLIKITGYYILDPIVAILVALLIFKAAYDLIRKAFLPLLDTAADEDTMEIVTRVLHEFEYGFIEYHDLRSRRAGREVHIDLHMVVNPQLSIQEAHELCDVVEQRIEKEISYSSVLIHVEPAYEAKT
jgi:cation diffusion facilitator family transporter